MTAVRPARFAFVSKDRVGARIPVLGVQALRAIYEAEDSTAALFALLDRRDAAYGAIHLASESLGTAVDKWLDTPLGGKHASLVSSSLAYVARSAMRCTPLAACASVSLVPVTEEPCPRRVSATLRTRTRIDAAFLYGLATKYESTPDAVAAVCVRSAGTSTAVADRLEVLDGARSSRTADDFPLLVSPATSLKVSPAVRFVLEAARKPVLGGELAERIAEHVGASKDAALALLVRMVELGILVTELRLALTQYRVERFVELVSRFDPTASAGLAAIVAEMGEMDRADIADKPARIRAIRGHATALQPAAGHMYQMDATRDLDVAIPVALLERTEQAFHLLARIARPNLQAQRIAELFLTKFNEGREVPLLQLLHAPESFNFESVISRATVARAEERRSEELLALASEAIVSGRSVVSLDDLIGELAASHPPECRFADSYEILAHVIVAPDGELMPGLWSGFHEGAGRSLARFSDMFDSAAFEQTKPAVPEREGWVCAEFTCLPHARRAANVASRANPFAYEIVDGVWSGTDPEHTILLDDLVVGVRANRMYVRSRRLGKFVAVHQSHMLRATMNSRIATFLGAISASEFPFVGFDWGPLASRLPYRPRVLLAQSVVAPASWKVPAGVASAFDGAAGGAWRALWNVPRYVYLSHMDNRILIDLNRAVCRIQVALAAKSCVAGGFIELHEALPGFDDAWLEDDAGGTYIAELAVSLERALPDPVADLFEAGDAPFEPPAVASYQRAPGSDWIYGRFYMPRGRIGHFAETQLRELVARLDGAFSDVHFVRYADPEPHLRVRIRVEGEAGREAVERAVVAAGRAWCANGWVERFELGTYDREVERYGGGAAIDTAERVFTADSLAVLARLGGLRTATDRPVALVLDLVLFVCAMERDLNRTFDWLKRVLGRRKHIDPPAWVIVKAVRAQLPLEAAAYSDIAATARELIARVPASRRDGVYRTLFHMHCNRVGLSPIEERDLLQYVYAAIEGECLRARAAALAPPTEAVGA